MYNFNSKNLVQPPGWYPKLLLIMKFTVLILFTAILHLSASSVAQKVTLRVNKEPLNKVFEQISSQTGYDFAYTTRVIGDARPVTINVANQELADVLKIIFASQPLDYSIDDKTVVINLKDPVGPAQRTESPKVQSINCTGTVVDEKGQPLSGISIRLKGQQKTWATDIYGTFAIQFAEPEGILQFSCVGFQTFEIAVKDFKSPAKIVLKEAIGTLDNVEILAYGTTSKRLSTGNVTTIIAKDIAKHPVANVLQALQNQVPGLFIQQNTGNLGGAFQTLIRMGSTLQGASPLYIVDGVQYPAGKGLGFNSAPTGSKIGTPVSGGGNALNYINPDDIESVSILKDADATALYGSRGAYGVILITTKRGKAGPASLSVNLLQGITIAGATPKLLNTQDYLLIRREAFANDGLSPGAADLDVNGAWPADRYNDWKKYYLNTKGLDQQVDLSYQGGSELNTFLISGSLHNQRSIQKAIGGQIDGNMRMNVSSTSRNRKFFVDFVASYNLSRNNALPWDFSQALTAAPNAPVPILPDGTLDWSTGSNAAAAINAKYLNTNNNLLANLNLRYNLTKDLTLNTTLSYNLLAYKEYQALPSTYFVPSPTVNTQTTSTINTSSNRNFAADPNLSYQHTFFKKLNVESRIGFTAQDTYTYQLQTTGYNFNSDQLLPSPTSASGTITSQYRAVPTRYLGAFVYGRLNWAGKYLLSLNARRDGSTSFGPNNRFGNFGSIAGAWVISEESWMKPLSKVLSFVKLRASYGTTGGDQVFPYAYLSTFGVSPAPYAGSIGFTPGVIANPDLHWEYKRSAELGLNLQFLAGRIELDASAYRNTTGDALIPMSLPSITGYNNINTNSPDAKLLTWGYEASLNTVNIKSKNFRWTSSFNISIPRSKLVSFPGLVDENSVNAGFSNYRLNKPVTGTMLFEYAGVNPQTGMYSFVNAKGVKGDFGFLDLNNVTDRTQFVDYSPRYYGGFGNTFSYKNLSLDFFMLFTSRQGKTLEASSYPNSYPGGTFNVNMTPEVLNRWQKPGDITAIPKASNSFQSYLSKVAMGNSNGAFVNTTYLRLQNVNLNYRFTGSWLDKAKVKNLRVFIRAENLLTISKFKDMDPENLNPNSLGPLRVFTAGLNVSL